MSTLLRSSSRTAAPPSSDRSSASTAVVLTAALLALGVGCTPPDGGDAVRTGEADRDTAPPTSQFAGVPLETPARLPDLRFPATPEGDSTPLHRVLDHPVNLLFIGFTNCPDICPVHLANLGAVLRELPLEVEREIAVAFVTADPERDSIRVIGEWLGALHHDFVGFRPDRAGVNALEDALGIPHSVVDPGTEAGDYVVAHASQIIAFDAQGRARLAYPWGIRQRDWEADLPRLVRGEWPELPVGGR